jgi:hypothetical protein
LRFAFYGRVSTEDWQDPVTSRARQREQADALVRGHGQVVAEFFDEGESRTVAWGRRPQAAALVAQLADACRGWDAIVIGEYERAFYGSTATAAPWEASRRTIAAPIPRLPPVTKARLPSRLDVDVMALPVLSPSFALVRYRYYFSRTVAPMTTAAGAKSPRGRWRVRNAASAAPRTRRRGRVGGDLARRRGRRV